MTAFQTLALVLGCGWVACSLGLLLVVRAHVRWERRQDRLHAATAARPTREALSDRQWCAEREAEFSE